MYKIPLFPGLAFSKIGQQDLAIADFSIVLQLNPDHVNAAFGRAACYNTMGLFSQAIEDYNFALLKDQNNQSQAKSATRGLQQGEVLQSNSIDNVREHYSDFRQSSSGSFDSPLAAYRGTNGASLASEVDTSLHSPMSVRSIPNNNYNNNNNNNDKNNRNNNSNFNFNNDDSSVSTFSSEKSKATIATANGRFVVPVRRPPPAVPQAAPTVLQSAHPPQVQ